ncbi:MAG: glycosyltransferase, partial [Alphaproteobacteria bacterium]
NAHFMGRQGPRDLPAIMAGFDICFIPYVIDRYTRGVLPLKFFEYLATGKPVISTPLPELAQYGEMIDLASGAEPFAEAIEKRLSDDPHQKQRIELASKNSWEHRIHQILSILEKVYQDKQEDLL